MKSIIFDVDGTLVDSVDLHATAWKIAFARFGHDFTHAKIRSQIGKGGDQLLPFFLSRAEVNERGEAITAFRGKLFQNHFRRHIQPFPGVQALFRHLQAEGWKLAIASSSKKDDLTHLLKLCRIDDLADVVVSADDAKKSKPHPDIFLAARQGLGAQSRECYVIGDSPYDADAAARAKMTSIGFLSGGFPAAWLKRSGVQSLYRDPADLLRRYRKSPLAAAMREPDVRSRAS